MLTPDGLDKFQAQWSGPYTVEEKVSEVTYRIATPQQRKKSRLYHVNMINKWTTPATIMTITCTIEEEEGARKELPIYTLDMSQHEKPKVNPHLTAEQTYQMENLLQELEEDFSNQPGYTEEITHAIRTGNSPPVYQHPY